MINSLTPISSDLQSPMNTQNYQTPLQVDQSYHNGIVSYITKSEWVVGVVVVLFFIFGLGGTDLFIYLINIDSPLPVFMVFFPTIFSNNCHFF